MLNSIIIIIIIITFLLLHYVLFLFKVYSGLKKLFPINDIKIPDEFVSIIIPFRNEEKNIRALYQNLITQEYPKNRYEIIFINDSSEDNSLQVLQSLKKESNVSVYTLPKDFSINAHKKRAIRFGIEKAKGDIIVTTDADCIHKSEWLKNLLKFMDPKTGFVSGPVEFMTEENLFVKMQKLEFAGLVITGAGLIGSGNPIICNAANIAYRKKIYEQVGGFQYNMNLSSGDDELLMQKIKRDTNYEIRFALDKDAIVSTYANSSLKDFYYQRKRWASKGLFYNDSFLLIKLTLIFLFYLSFLVQPILGLLFSPLFFLTLFMSFLIKMVTEFVLMKKGVELLFDKKILKPYIVTEIFQIPYILIAGFMGIFGNFVWKDRKVTR